MAAKNKKLEELAKKNPLVDMDQLREAQALVKEYRKNGAGKPQYDIESPFGSRPTRAKKQGEPPLSS